MRNKEIFKPGHIDSTLRQLLQLRPALSVCAWSPLLPKQLVTCKSMTWEYEDISQSDSDRHRLLSGVRYRVLITMFLSAIHGAVKLWFIQNFFTVKDLRINHDKSLYQQQRWWGEEFTSRLTAVLSDSVGDVSRGILFNVSVFASDFDANLLLSGYTFRHSECVNSSLIMSNYFLEWKEFHCCRSSESEVCSFTMWISYMCVSYWCSEWQHRMLAKNVWMWEPISQQ